MPLDINKLINPKPYDCIQTSIGQLCIFGMNLNDQSELSKQLGKDVQKCEPEEYIRNLLVFICYPKIELKDGNKKPDSSVLDLNDVNKLDTNELNEISKIYVNNNIYLFKKLEFTKSKNDKGEIVNSSKYSGIAHPKENDENYISYLYRLSVFEKEKQKKRMEELFSKIPKITSFSSKLADTIKNNISYGDLLSKKMESIRPAHIGAFSAPLDITPNFDWIKTEQRREEKRLKPYNELGERLDILIESTVQASEFMIEANKIQTTIASEIKSSGDTTTKYSKFNIFLSVIVIIISVSSLGLSAYAIISNNSLEESRNNHINSNSKDIINKLSDIDSNLEKNNSDSYDSLIKIIGNIEESNRQDNAFNELLKKNITIINNLNIENEKQKENIEILESKVSELERKFGNKKAQ